MNILSDVLISEIIPLLSLKEIHHLSQTGPEMRKLCKEEQVWHHISERDFPNSGSKTTSWFDFYVESYNHQHLINYKYGDAPRKPCNISYIKYYEMLESARHKIPLTFSFDSNKKDKNLGRIYVIPGVTTLESFLQNIEDKIGSINYVLSFEAYSIVEVNTRLYSFSRMIYKINNDYIIKASLVRSTTDNAIINVFRYGNLKMVVCEEDYCPYTFHLSDEYFKSYLMP